MTTANATYSGPTVHPSLLIPHFEQELIRAKEEVSRIAKTLSILKKSAQGGAIAQVTDMDLILANLKWRKEIRHCMSLRTTFQLLSSNNIAACVVKQNNLPAIDRNIKTKISSTLSLMHKEGEIGRVKLKFSGEFLYGTKEYFEEDLTTLKAEYRPQIEYLLEK